MRIFKRLVIRTAADPLRLVGAVTTAMADVDPDLVPYDITTMDAWLASSAEEEKFWLQLLGLFAGLAVALAAIGFYGVISFAVTQRTHELGVRTALGAQRTDVFTLIVRRGLVLALLGVAIGIPGRRGSNRRDCQSALWRHPDRPGDLCGRRRHVRLHRAVGVLHPSPSRDESRPDGRAEV